MAGEFAFSEGNVPSAVNWNANVRDQLTIICTSSTRPGSPSTGRRIYETDTGKEYVYSGSVWTLVGDNRLYAATTAYTPTWGSSGTAPAIGNGTLSGRWRYVGEKLISVMFIMVAGSTTTFGTGGWTFSLPSPFTAAANWCIVTGMTYGGTYFPSHGLSTTTLFYPYTATATADVRITAISATVPFAWANTNQLQIMTLVEVA